MAPEVILGDGYKKKSDIWSLGIFIYELICGFVPFGELLNDPFDIYNEIL